MKTKITLYYLKYAALDFFLGTQERVGKSRGKRAINARAAEGLLYLLAIFFLVLVSIAQLQKRFSFDIKFINHFLVRREFKKDIICSMLQEEELFSVFLNPSVK